MRAHRAEEVSKLKKYIIMDQADNIAVALTDLEAGYCADVLPGLGKAVQLADPIEFGHKFSLTKIMAGGEVLKYGAVIGRASQIIEQGRHVHVHNVESIRARGDKKE